MIGTDELIALVGIAIAMIFWAYVVFNIPGGVRFYSRKKKTLRVWVNTTFKGYWPTGTAAVVVADTAEDAAEILAKTLLNLGIPSSIAPQDMVLVNTDKMLAIVLRDGSY